MRTWRAAVLGFVTLSACGLDSTYACTSDAHCSDGQSAGRCELDGYCSFEDDTCPTGRRYGMWAPTAVARLCVDSSASVTSTAGSSSGQPTSGEASTTLDASTTSGSTGDATSIAVTMDPTGDSTTSSSRGEESDSSSSGSIDVLDPDLIAWYRFDTLEDGSVPDSSRNDHLASCEQCPDAIDGVYEGAIETDGIAQHLVVANTPQFTTQTWTIAAWVWSGETPTTFQTVVGKPLGVGVANSYELAMNLSNESTSVVSGWSDGFASQGLAVALPASQEWFHVTATLSDTTATLYLDGEVVDEEVLAIIPALDDNDLHIGADIDDQVLDNFFFGRIDDLRIYRRALTVDEVSVIMAGENL